MIVMIIELFINSHCRQRARKYKCDPKDDDDCRCDDPDRPKECCDNSRNCRSNCCERCSGGSTRKSRSCNLCDDRGPIQIVKTIA